MRDTKGKFVKGHTSSPEIIRKRGITMKEKYKSVTLTGKTNTRDCFGRFVSGHKPSSETKLKMSNSHKDNPQRYWLGRKITQKMRDAISKANKEKVGELAPNWRGGKTPIYKKLRTAALRVSGGTHTKEDWEKLKTKYLNMCLCCKRAEPSIVLTKDHIVPVSKGGTDDISNIQPLCKSCNSRKHVKDINYISQFYELRSI